MKTVFVLGAGASMDAGCPTMAGFLDRTRDMIVQNYFNDEDRKDLENVINALYEVQGVHYKASLDLDNVEEVFSILDMAVLINKFGGRSKEEIEELRRQIRKLIYQTIDGSVGYHGINTDRITVRGSYPYFVDQVSKTLEGRQNDTVAILTFNYDLALDYTLENSDIPFTYGLGINDNEENSQLVKYYKLHGSLNWGCCDGHEQGCHQLKVCPVSSILQFVIYALNISGSKRVSEPVVPNLRNEKCICGRPIKEPFIVPPTWSKGNHYSAIRPVWQKAAQALGQAEAIYVIGYSLPPSDMFFRYLFALGTHSRASIRHFWVFDPDPTVKGRFEELLGKGAGDFKFFKMKFHEAIPIIAESLEQ